MKPRRIWALAAPDDEALRSLAEQDIQAVCHTEDEVDALELPASGFDAVVLLGDTLCNCRTAQRWRARDEETLMVAAMRHARLSEQMALLRVGVDWVLRNDEGARALEASLYAFWQRRRPGGCPSMRIGPWTLIEQGWWLQHDRHGRLRLTVPERAVLLALFQAPGNVVVHAELAAVLDQARQEARLRLSSNPSIRHIFSRLKSRAAAKGLEIPIESISNYGYAWV